MAPEEKKAPKKRKKIIKITTKFNNDDDTPLTEAQLALQQQALELIRNQAIKQIATADDSKYGTPEEQMQSVAAAHRYLWSYGFDCDELRKGWKELSTWRA